MLVAQGPCALLPEARKRWVPLHVLSDKCSGCTLCFRLGCPAILKSEELDERHHRPKALIDATLRAWPRGVRRALPAQGDSGSGEGQGEGEGRGGGRGIVSLEPYRFSLGRRRGPRRHARGRRPFARGARGGVRVKSSEIHGMSQRGGSVEAHVRWGGRVFSPVAFEGEADVLLAFEKVEALRCAGRVRPGALCIVDRRSIVPVSVTSGGTSIRATTSSGSGSPPFRTGYFS